MTRNLNQRIALLAMMLLTGVSLSISFQALAVDATVIASRNVELVIYSLVTAFAIILSVPLARGELSIAHAIGLMALLSLPVDVAPAMTFSVFLGGIAGGLVRSQIQEYRRRSDSAWYVSTTYVATSVTVSYFAASMMYIYVFRGQLPISDSSDISQNALALAATVFAYVVIYFAAYLLQLQTIERIRSALQDSALQIGIILILPVPFALMGASVAQADQSVLFFSITIVGAVLIIFGLFALNRSQQRFRRQLEEMRSLSVATQAMRGNLDLDGLLRTTYVQVSQLLDTQNFTVALYDEIEMRMNFPLVIHNGEEVTERDVDRLPPDYPLIKHIVDSGIALLLDNDVLTRAEELDIQGITRPIASWLGVPLITGDKPFGAFIVQSYDQRRFDDDDLRVMNIIVASMSIAIENARLYRQKSVRAEQLATLNQVTSLLTGTLAPNEVLDMVVSSASTISEADAVAVYLLDVDDKPVVTLARSAGLSDSFLYNPPYPLLASSMTRQTTDSFFTPSSLLVQNLDDPKLLPIRQKIVDEGKQAYIEHPLTFAGQNLGVLCMYYSTPQIFHPEQIDMIQAFATQAAQAINNAQRFESADRALEQRVEQLYALAAMGRLLNASLETDKIYDIVLTYATDATKAPRGFIVVYRPNGRLVVAAQKGYPHDMFADAEFLQQGLTGRVLSSGQTLRIPDTRQETGYLPLVAQTRSTLITPIMKGRDILGLIMLESDTAGSFSEGDGHFVAQIANQAVVAADNTLLFQRVREARDNMKVILDAMQEGIILIDEQNHVALANPHINLIELSADDILDQSIDDLLADENLRFAEHLGFSNPQALRHLLQSMHRHWESHPLHDYEIHGENFGVRYIQRQIIPVRDEDRHISGIMLVFYNKSEERELATARESLSQMIVHDLRSPLTAVTTSLRLLQELVPPEAEFAQLVEKTTGTSRRAIRKVLTRVDSLLDISKMESGEMKLEREPSSINLIVENVMNELAPLADELEVSLRTDLGQNLPLLDIDADKIERMVLNLVDNALKYSPRDSEVLVRVRKMDTHFLQLEVQDRGPGIPDDYKPRLFDRFVQIEGRKTVRRGVGLGLTFCKLVTEAHGGDIWVADNPGGNGSVFKARLPIAKLSEAIQ